MAASPLGTRAIARHVLLDVIQAQIDHASIQTTTAICGRAPIKRRVDELGKAFSGTAGSISLTINSTGATCHQV